MTTCKRDFTKSSVYFRYAAPGGIFCIALKILPYTTRSECSGLCTTFSPVKPVL